MAVDITQIPDVMRAKGWTQGEALMRRWFAGPSRTKPDLADPDETTVLMDWVLGFSRGRRAYDDLINARGWSNPAARREIAGRLASRAIPPDSCFAFTGLPASRADAAYINSRQAGSQSDPLDGLSAALGRFNLHLVIDGQATNLGGGRHRVEVLAYGVFVVDSYDFNDDAGYWVSQPLACWDIENREVGTGFFGMGSNCVRNDDFRAWRAANGRGGDFLVYSDIKRTVLPAPDVFEVGP